MGVQFYFTSGLASILGQAQSLHATIGAERGAETNHVDIECLELYSLC